MAAIDDSLDPDASDTHAATHGKLAHFEEVETDAAERGVGHGAAAEGEIEVGEVGAAEGEDFGGGVGEGAAEGLGLRRLVSGLEKLMGGGKRSGYMRKGGREGEAFG